MGSEQNSAQKQTCCLGITYWQNAAMRSGKQPVCYGISKDRSGLADATSDNRVPQQEKRPLPWQYYCLGFAAYEASRDPNTSQHASKQGSSSAAPEIVMPHCEGIEVMFVEQLSAAAQASDRIAAQSSAQGSGMLHNAQHQGPGSQAGPSSAGSEDSAAQRQQQAARTPAESSSNSLFDQADADKPRPPLHERLMAQAAKNVDRMRAALNNEGPVRLRPLPPTRDELQTQLMETAQRNASRVVSTASRSAASVYDATLKPVVDKISAALTGPKAGGKWQ